ncbi:class IV adenylate cyclase [Natrialbaceae archaeon AArc-T1-2]|uniref:class IV adenylate cyclase n=1 Tax=Natrialbaceae archaeon AArc-T1-2 TaxID=3053904 RepID=UPI00255ADAED|nr:class IV adenylate cyclase [Natrialbaceae archaeon AArc-T1-2]WIV66441.1 class IV adenylate cyclase [Natrialbaceae archaeon AArc-T1-2]
MYEVEVKVPADLEAVRDRLGDLEADALATVVQEDTYYDAPHRSFPETDEALRIRRETVREGRIGDADSSNDTNDTDGSRLTYKGPLVDDESKTREEVETRLEDAAEMDAILTNLGFEPAATVRKERERFALEGYTVTLDRVDDVGTFVEVETEAEKADLESAREGAFGVLDQLGLDPDASIRTSYLELALEK